MDSMCRVAERRWADRQADMRLCYGLACTAPAARHVTSIGHRLFGHLQAMPPLFKMDKLNALFLRCSANLTWCSMRQTPQTLALPVQMFNRAHVNRYNHTHCQMAIYPPIRFEPPGLDATLALPGVIPPLVGLSGCSMQRLM